MPKYNRLLTSLVWIVCCGSIVQAREQILFSTQVSTGLDNRSSLSTTIPITINSSVAQLAVGDFIQIPDLENKGSYRIKIETVIRHSNSNVTLIGHIDEQGSSYRAIITLGQAGNYAKIATPAGDYRIELNNSQNLLRTPSAQKQLGVSSFIDDMLIPDRGSSVQTPNIARVPAEQQGLTDGDTSTDIAIVDVMLLYTAALETRLAGALQTRLNHLIAITNQAYVDSQVHLRLRLVHSEVTSYNNNANALDALQALQQHTGSFTQVPALRTQYGADLVILIQDFKPTDIYGSCGLAYRLGGFTVPGHMDSDDKDWAFSVIYDGQHELSGGSYSFCPEHTLAHEVGHNLGAAHDLNHLGVNSTGLFNYSHGHDDSPANNQLGTFATIMSYDQPSVLKFSNPDINCTANLACGVKDQTDNARGFNQIRNEVAAFYPTQVFFDTDEDGVNDSVDNCPDQPNSDQANLDSDQLGDVCDADKDGDEIANISDNCPLEPNKNQTNLDLDHLGDVCDPDLDGDGITNILDAFPYNPAESADPDGDGIGSHSDNCPLTFNKDQLDGDKDGQGDACDTEDEKADPDGDGIANGKDNCPFIPNRNQVNTDGDAQGDACDDDDDNDGRSDRWEYQHGFNPLIENLRRDVDSDGDGYTDLDEARANTDPKDPQDHIPAIRSLTIDTPVDSDWHTITMNAAIAPVVFAGPPSLRDPTPGVVRIDHQGNEFKIKIQPWNYLGAKATHDLESVPLMVLEQGIHTMSDGSIWEVGTFQIRDSRQWQTIPLKNDFAEVPRLFLSTQTYNGHDAITVRAKNITTKTFQAALYEEEKNNAEVNNFHADETVGYLAVYSLTGSGAVKIENKEVAYILQQVDVNHVGTQVLNSILIAQEEQSQEAETDHVLETYDVLNIGSRLFAQQVSSLEADTVAPRQTSGAFPDNIEWGTVTGVKADWVTIPLSHHYQRSVVVVESASTHPVRLRKALSGSFQVHIEGETEGQSIHYLVAEHGQHAIAGLTFEAGLVASRNHQTRSVDFLTRNFTHPAVFSSVMTAFSSGPVKAIATTVEPSKATLSMSNPAHPLEVLGWIAIDSGSTDNTYQGREAVIVDMNLLTDDESTLIDFLSTPRLSPIILKGDTHNISNKTSVFVAE